MVHLDLGFRATTKTLVAHSNIVRISIPLNQARELRDAGMRNMLNNQFQIKQASHPDFYKIIRSPALFGNRGSLIGSGVNGRLGRYQHI